jgi:hypothetical protein
VYTLERANKRKSPDYENLTEIERKNTGLD